MLAIVIAAALVFVNAPDDDTMVVRDGGVKTVLRLAEVDAPERTQPYRQVSRRNLIDLCKDKPISFEPVSTDRNGHTVAMVTCDGVAVNWRQVQDGLAWCFTKYLTQPAPCLPLERDARVLDVGYGARIHRCRLGNFERRRSPRCLDPFRE